ncbi:MAG: MarR family winged helix-turn-helix transcriptional regulator [Bacteroidota bacterium]
MPSPQPPGPCSQIRRDFGLITLRLARRWRDVVDGELRSFGVTTAMWRALFHLGASGRGARPKDLAEALEMERSSLTQLVDRLERDKLVVRRDDPTDHRCKTVHSTDEGIAVYQRTLDASSRVAERLMADITDAELETVLSVFARISAAIEAERSVPGRD